MTPRKWIFALCCWLGALARADMDAPRWYEFMKYDFTVENLADFPDVVLVSRLDDEHLDEPQYYEAAGNQMPAVGATWWIEKARYESAHLALLAKDDSATKALYRPVKFESYLRLYSPGDKTLTTIADPVESVAEKLRMRREAGGITIASRVLVFTFKDGRKVEMDPRSIDPKRPLFWLKPARAFQFANLGGYPEYDFVLVEAPVWRDSHARPVWDGGSLRKIQEGKRYEAAGENRFYLVYAIPKGFLESTPKDDWTTRISEHNRGEHIYLGGFFASKSSKAPVTTVGLEDSSGRPYRLRAPSLDLFFPTPAPVPIAEAAAPDRAPAQAQADTPDRRWFLGIPLLAAAGIALVVWKRRKRATKA